MKYVILVLLLLTFGCTQQAATENVTDNGTLHPPSDVADANDSSSEDEEPTSEEDEPTSSETTANVSEVPTISNPDWGTECEYGSECGTFKEMKDCVMGHCVDIECKFRSDCDGKDHCFGGKCYLEDELYSEFPECGVNIGCNTTCTGCEVGLRRCLITGWQSGEESMEYYICAECSSDTDCSDGYNCVRNYCMKGPYST